MMILLTKWLNIFIHRTLNIGFQYGKLCFLCVTCSTFITILLLWTKIELNSNKNINVLFNNDKRSIDLYMPTTPRKVTKSLSEIMKMVPEVNEDIVFFNSIPRSGSELIVLLLQWLEDLNGFKHMRLPKGNRHRLSRYDQEKLIQSMMKEVREGAVPFTFDRHVYFINFTSFGHQSPTYMNLIRDPIDKAIARYYYHQVTPTPAYSVTKPSKVSSFKSKLRYAIVRDFEKCVLSNEPRCMYTNGDLYDLTIPYFCGHEERCMMLNDRWALNRAKENVERYYSVVGILEEVNKTLIVLQHRLPYFFRDVLNTFNMQLTDNSKTRSLYRPTRVLNEEVKTKLKNQLLTEYEFYEYIKQRLLNQYDIASEELNL